MAKKIHPMNKLNFVREVISSDVFNSNDLDAVAILQDLIDSAKKDMVAYRVKQMDKDARKRGEKIANRQEVIDLMLSKFTLDQNDIYSDVARELGVKL